MNDLILAPKSLDEAKSLSSTLSKSMLLPEAYRGKEADVLLTIMTGAEMGLGPTQSLRAFDVIKGKPAMKPEAMVAVVRAAAGVEFIRLVESTPTKAVWESKFRNAPQVMRSEFTWDDAKTAQLAGQDNYRKWPARMLQWRCASQHCKAHHSDLILGLYSTEEAQSFDAPVERDATPAKGEAIDTTATVAAAKEAVKAKRMRIVDEPAKPAPTPPKSGPTSAIVVGFGPHKARAVVHLTDAELTESATLAESKLKAEPQAEWAPSLRTALDTLYDEQRFRAENAAESVPS